MTNLGLYIKSEKLIDFKEHIKKSFEKRLLKVGVIIVERIYYEKQMTIISQNLYNYRKKNIKGLGQVDSYRNNYKANVYAFQEYAEWGRGKSFIPPFMTMTEKIKGM